MGSDAESIDTLLTLRRAMRMFGREWSNRLHYFLGFMLVADFLLAAYVVFIALAKSFLNIDLSYSAMEIYLFLMPLLAIYSLPLWRALPKAVLLAVELNTCGELYWPLALQTVKANLRRMNTNSTVSR